MIEIFSAEDVPQGGDLWFEKRCGSLGASRVKDAIAGGQGKSRKTLAYQLIAETITGNKTEMFVTPAMQWGVDTEPQARAAFEFENGMNIEEVGLVVNSDFPGCHASPDGLSKATGLEIKCPMPHTFVKYLDEDRLPPEYKAQVMYTMLICELKTYWFFAFHPAFNKSMTVKVDRDEKYLDEMQVKLETFFQELEAIKTKIQ